MSYKSDWIEKCLELAATPADFYAGGRKILVNRTFVFNDIDQTLQMDDAGYTKAKLSHLTRNYLHQESKDVAMALWERRLGQAKYGSVGFTCYAHFVKGGSIDAKRSKRASVFGPCIQAVTLTWISRTETTVDVYYRTTEVLKKFPADLVFIRDVLLSGFNLTGMKLKLVCHFANVTVHPMYFITIIPCLADPFEEMEKVRIADKYFYDWLIKWSARYVCDEYMRGILKFSQALRVRDTSLARIKPKRLAKLQAYFRANHPGYRSAYQDPDESDDEE